MLLAFTSLMAMTMNAVGLLKEDHQRISGLFELFEKSRKIGERLTLFQQIRDEVDLHSMLEERVFYPALSKFDALTAVIDQFYDQHDEMGDIIEEIDQMEPEEENYDELNDAVHELTELFQQHTELEERELYERAGEFLNQDTLVELADRMNELRGLSKAA
jgi:hemerythrin superfamily protein